MILSVSNQVYVFLLCVSIGVLAGFIFDLFRIIRKSFKHKNIYIQIEDILYWIIVTFISFLIILHKNNGEIRIYGFIAILIGYLINEYIFSKWTVQFGVKIIKLYIKLIKIIIASLILPIKTVLKIFEKPLLFIKNKTKTKMRSTKNTFITKNNNVKSKLNNFNEKIKKQRNKLKVMSDEED